MNSGMPEVILLLLMEVIYQAEYIFTDFKQAIILKLKK